MTGQLSADPAAITAVIDRQPCAQCGVRSFVWVGAIEYDELRVTQIAEYHRGGCPLLAHGGYVIATVPVSEAHLAGLLLEPSPATGRQRCQAATTAGREPSPVPEPDPQPEAGP
jgi:hypothetical protein